MPKLHELRLDRKEGELCILEFPKNPAELLALAGKTAILRVATIHKNYVEIGLNFPRSIGINRDDMRKRRAG